MGKWQMRLGPSPAIEPHVPGQEVTVEDKRNVGGVSCLPRGPSPFPCAVTASRRALPEHPEEPPAPLDHSRGNWELMSPGARSAAGGRRPVRLRRRRRSCPSGSPPPWGPGSSPDPTRAMDRAREESVSGGGGRQG